MLMYLRICIKVQGWAQSVYEKTGDYNVNVGS